MLPLNRTPSILKKCLCPEHKIEATSLCKYSKCLTPVFCWKCAQNHNHKTFELSKLLRIKVKTISSLESKAQQIQETLERFEEPLCKNPDLKKFLMMEFGVKASIVDAVFGDEKENNPRHILSPYYENIKVNFNSILEKYKESIAVYEKQLDSFQRELLEIKILIHRANDTIRELSTQFYQLPFDPIEAFQQFSKVIQTLNENVKKAKNQVKSLKENLEKEDKNLLYKKAELLSAQKISFKNIPSSRDPIEFVIESFKREFHSQLTAFFNKIFELNNLLETDSLPNTGQLSKSIENSKKQAEEKKTDNKTVEVILIESEENSQEKSQQKMVKHNITESCERESKNNKKNKGNRVEIEEKKNEQKIDARDYNVRNDKIHYNKLQSEKIYNDKMQSDKVRNDTILSDKAKNDKIFSGKVQKDKIESDEAQKDQSTSAKAQSNKVLNNTAQSDQLQKEQQMQVQNPALNTNMFFGSRIQSTEEETQMIQRFLPDQKMLRRDIYSATKEEFNLEKLKHAASPLCFAILLIETKCDRRFGLFLDQLKPKKSDSYIFNFTDQKAYKIRNNISMKDVSRVVDFKGHEDYSISEEGILTIALNFGVDLNANEKTNYLGNKYEISKIQLDTVVYDLSAPNTIEMIKFFKAKNASTNKKSNGYMFFKDYHRETIAKKLNTIGDDDWVLQVLRAEWNNQSTDQKKGYTNLARNKNTLSKTRQKSPEIKDTKETKLGKRAVYRDITDVKIYEKVDQNLMNSQENQNSSENMFKKIKINEVNFESRLTLPEEGILVVKF